MNSFPLDLSLDHRNGLQSHSIAWHHHIFPIEATGDSEGDAHLLEYSAANLPGLIWMNLGGLPLICSEDDAESCSCECPTGEHTDFEAQDFHDSNDTKEELMVEEEEQEEEVAEESRHIGRVNGGSRKMVEDELEGDRLFWETCLEGGYP